MKTLHHMDGFNNEPHLHFLFQRVHDLVSTPAVREKVKAVAKTVLPVSTELAAETVSPEPICSCSCHKKTPVLTTSACTQTVPQSVFCISEGR